MKLLTKTNLNFLSISLFIFLFGIFAFYYILRKQVDDNVNLELLKQKTNILNQFDSTFISANINKSYFDKIVISKVDKSASNDYKYSDTLMYDNFEKKNFVYRQFVFYASCNNKNYCITIYKSLEESDKLIVKIFLIMTILVFVIIISLLFFNRQSSLKAWNVFYDTIDKIKNYDLDSHEQFNLKHSDVKEFDDLNKVLLAMTDKIKTDYFNLKEYTENASHEIQTPLAIINTKMELLLQSSDLNENQLKAISDVYEAANRLSKLNNSLILLSKIENRQFPESKQIDPNNIINSQLEILEDLILSKNIKVEINFTESLIMLMNPYLAEILFSNLIRNAIRHNIESGKLLIDTFNDKLVISNTGSNQKVDIETLFKRFHKSSSSSESLGLGLPIVQKICEIYGFILEYEFEKGMHSMKINFKKSEKKVNSKLS